jgi:hypothetical protein
MIAVRILVASILTAAVARGVWALCNGVLGLSLFGQLISVGAAVILGAGFYVWTISHMRVPEWQQISAMLGSRLRP